VILQRAAEEKRLASTACARELAEPFFLRFAEIAASRVGRANLSASILKRSLQQQRDLGDLWLVARWYYSNPREGEIFFHEKDGRIVGFFGCSRLLAPKNSEAETTKQQPAQPPKERSMTIRYQRGNDALRTEVCGRAAEVIFRETQELLLLLGIARFSGSRSKDG